MDWLTALQGRLERWPSRRLRRRPADARAAVLVPLVPRQGLAKGPARPEDVELLLVRRSLGLARHPGQIAFPGGRIEPTDRSIVGAAIREAEEETAMPQTAIRPVGELSDQRTPTGWVITPVLAVVYAPGPLRACPAEIAELIHLPLNVLLDRSSFRRITRSSRDLLVHGDALVWRGHVVWGATARILLGLRRLLLGTFGDCS